MATAIERRKHFLIFEEDTTTHFLCQRNSMTSFLLGSYKKFGKGVIPVKLPSQVMTFYLDEYLSYKRKVHSLRAAYVREIVSHILWQ